jgi:hypothetical protein
VACFLNLRASSSRILDRERVQGERELRGLACCQRSRPFHGVSGAAAAGVEGSRFLTMVSRLENGDGDLCWRLERRLLEFGLNGRGF